MSELKPFSVFEWDLCFPSRWAIDGEGIGLLTFDRKEVAEETAAYMNIAFKLGESLGIKQAARSKDSPEGAKAKEKI